MEKRICELCGAEYPLDSQQRNCTAQYPDLFNPGLDTNCGGIILPAPTEEARNGQG